MSLINYECEGELKKMKKILIIIHKELRKLSKTKIEIMKNLKIKKVI
jgi:hypothetical protein